jgi:hypothetical protein
MMWVGVSVFYAGLAAQESHWPDFEYIRQSDVRLTSENASGLQYLPVWKIASAQAFINQSQGGFVNYHQPDKSYEWGAMTESFLHLSPKIVLYGQIDYLNSNGKNGSGSVFIDPYSNAFDILTGAGDKNLEKYHLIGAIALKLSSRLSLGGKVDYKAANYAKYKDLRHRNSLLDISVSLGFSYHFHPNMELGANYFYRRSVEGLEFSVYGTTDQLYSSLVSFGAFYGRSELFGESGYTYGNNPTFNEFNGASLQVDWKLHGQWRLFNEFSYKSREGYYGKRSPSSPVFIEHNASVLAYSGALSYGSLHSLKMNLENERLKVFENVYVRENQPGGKTDIVYYGKNKTSDKQKLNVGIVYTAYLGVKEFHPDWVLQAGADYRDYRQTVSLYPFYRKQAIHVLDARLQMKKNLIRKKNHYDVSAGLNYGFGGGTAKDDGVYAAPSESQRKPQSSDDYLYREYEYLTAPRIRANMGLGYSRLLNSGVRGYVHLDYELTSARKIEYLAGKTFHSAVLSIGCVF